MSSVTFSAPIRRCAAAFALVVLGVSILTPAQAQAARRWTASSAPSKSPLLFADTDLPETPEPQSPSAPSPSNAAALSNSATDDLSIVGTPKRILVDELHVLRSPAHLHRQDLRWLLPVAAASAASFSTDSYTMRHVVSSDPGFNDSSQNSSNALLGVAIGGPTVLFAVGEFTHREHPREAGLLSGEAMADAIILDEGIKYIALRERPGVDNANGRFFSGNGVSNPTFVSGHSIVTWSSAAVMAGEYSKPWQEIGIYTLASGVSLTRVLAQQHFPSDVLLGGVSGWLIGHYVYRSRHRAEHTVR